MKISELFLGLLAVVGLMGVLLIGTGQALEFTDFDSTYTAPPVTPVTYQTVIVNETSEDWNSDDQSNLEAATNGCARLYKYSVYLKKFIKHKPRSYYAICGEPIITGTVK